MERSEHYASDVPRFTRIRQPEEYNGRRLAGALIEHVEFDLDRGLVRIRLDDDQPGVEVPSSLRLVVETTAQRLDRLAWARAIVGETTTRCPVCGDPEGIGCCEFGRKP